MENSKELWLPVVGFEGYYEVSNMGNVRSLGRFVNHSKSGYKRSVPGRILEQTENTRRRGYMYITLKAGRNHKCCSVHRLVATAWINNPFLKSEVNHKDCNKKNNCVSNLEWTTPQENRDHAKTNGRTIYKNNGREKKILAYTKDGLFVGEFRSIRDAGRELGVFGQNICSILRGVGKYAKGYTFKLAA